MWSVMTTLPSANLTNSVRATLDPGIAQFREETRFWIQRVAVPVLMVIGLFGNSITVIIMTRRRMRSTTNMYLAALAFVDMLYLVLTFVLGLSHYPNMAHPKYYAYWQLKPFVMMLTDACSNTSVWLTVTFTIERYIAVRYPMKGKVWCTEVRAKMLIISVFALGILFAAPVPLEWEVVQMKIPSPEAQANKTIMSATKGASISDSDFHNNGPGLLDLAHGIMPVSSGQNIEVAGPKPWEQVGDESTPNTADQSKRLARPAKPIGNYKLALNYTEFGLNKTYKTIYYSSTAVIFYFIPLFSLMLFNGFLIKSVHQSKRERTRMLRPSNTSSTQCSTLKSESEAIVNGRANQVDTKSRNAIHSCSVSFECSQSAGIHSDKDSKRSPVLSLANRQGAICVSGDSSILEDSSQSSPLIAKTNTNRQSRPDGQRMKLDKLSSNGTSLEGSTGPQAALLIEEPSITGTSMNDNNEIKGLGQSSGSGHELVREFHELGVQINCEPDMAPTSGQGITKSDLSVEETEQTKSAMEICSLEKQDEHLVDDGKDIKDTIALKGSDASGLTRQGTLQRSFQTSAVSKSQHSFAPSSSQERRITIMLIAVVILFLVCQIPSAAMILYSSVHDPDPDTNEGALALALNNIFNFLMAVNAAGNFILYSFLSKRYRRTFIILFCGCLNPKKSSEAKGLFGVRFETSSQIQRHTNSIYQSNRFDDKVQKDTLV